MKKRLSNLTIFDAGNEGAKCIYPKYLDYAEIKTRSFPFRKKGQIFIRSCFMAPIPVLNISSTYRMIWRWRESCWTAPEQLALLQNYPNPFNPTTAISFELPEAAYVNLAIYNQKGQMVQRLVSGERPMGLHTVIWDAADEQGRHVPSGIYFYVLSVDGQSITRKLTLLK